MEVIIKGKGKCVSSFDFCTPGFFAINVVFILVFYNVLQLIQLVLTSIMLGIPGPKIKDFQLLIYFCDKVFYD